MAAGHYKNALHLFPLPPSGWTPKVYTYSGFYGLGIKELWDGIYEYIDFVKENGYFYRRRREQNRYWMYETIDQRLRNSFYHDPDMEQRLIAAENSIELGQQTSFMAAHRLLEEYFRKLKN